MAASSQKGASRRDLETHAAGSAVACPFLQICCQKLGQMLMPDGLGMHNPHFSFVEIDTRCVRTARRCSSFLHDITVTSTGPGKVSI